MTTDGDARVPPIPGGGPALRRDDPRRGGGRGQSGRGHPRLRRFAATRARPGFDRAVGGAVAVPQRTDHRHGSGRLHHRGRVRPGVGRSSCGSAVASLCPQGGQHADHRRCAGGAVAWAGMGRVPAGRRAAGDHPGGRRHARSGQGAARYGGADRAGCKTGGRSRACHGRMAGGHGSVDAQPLPRGRRPVDLARRDQSPHAEPLAPVARRRTGPPGLARRDGRPGQRRWAVCLAGGLRGRRADPRGQLLARRAAANVDALVP